MSMPSSTFHLEILRHVLRSCATVSTTKAYSRGYHLAAAVERQLVSLQLHLLPAPIVMLGRAMQLVCCALPTCAVIGLIRLGKDIALVWAIGYAYLADRWDDFTSGRNEKRFQMAIVVHYAGRITVDDAKELLHIAMNNGNFEWYLERDHGIRTTDHAPTLIQMREQTNQPGGLRDLFLDMAIPCLEMVITTRYARTCTHARSTRPKRPSTLAVRQLTTMKRPNAPCSHSDCTRSSDPSCGLLLKLLVI